MKIDLISIFLLSNSNIAVSYKIFAKLTPTNNVNGNKKIYTIAPTIHPSIKAVKSKSISLAFSDKPTINANSEIEVVAVRKVIKELFK